MLKVLTVGTAATDALKSTIIVEGEMEGNKRYFKTADEAANLPAVAFGTAITPGDWTELTSNGLEITPNAAHTVVRVVEVNASNEPIAVGDAVLNIG